MKKTSSIFLIIFFTLSSNLTLAASGNEKNTPVTLYISTPFTHPVSDYYKLVLDEIDQKTPEIQIKFEHLSAERSLELVNRGINDADCCRVVEAVNKSYPDLIPVTESFYTARFVAFSKNANLNIKSFEDLKPYSTATVIGWKILINNLNRIEPKEKYLLSTAQQMMKMLDKDRIEVALLGYEIGLKIIEQENMKNIHVYLNPPLAEQPMFMVLHKKNKHLVAPISNAIKTLKDDGTIDRLYKSVFSANTPH